MAVLVSGAGTIREAMLEAELPVALIVSDRSCRGLQRAVDTDLPTELIERDSFGPDFDRDRYSTRLADALDHHRIDLVAMAGCGTILTQPRHERSGGRATNTTPAT